MPNPDAPTPAGPAPLAGYRAWGPGVAGANRWAHRPQVVESLPAPYAADERQQLIVTRHGAVLVLLMDEADGPDVLAALEAAHTQVQRELLARRRTAL